jgi:MFS family permease
MKAGSYRHYMVAVLLLIAAHNVVDRTTLGLVLQDIKVDLHLSDTQLGVLTGIAFAMFYSLMGISIARWADRGHRIFIIALATALWSAAVVCSGIAQSFIQLLLIRVGVAVGEAGCLPPSHSLIADYFNRAERPRAVAIYMLGGPLGLLIGYLPAGWLNELYGWRITFMALGAPGVLLAALAWFTLREPRRERSSRAASILASQPARHLDGLTQVTAPPGLWKTCAILWLNPTFRHVLLSISVSGFFSYGILQWLPAFFIRSYGLATGAVGTWFAAISGLGGLIGTYLGGMLASRYAVRNERLQLKAIAIAYVVFVVFSAGVYVAPNQYLAFASLALSMVGGCTMNGPIFATIQLTVPARMRATAVALVNLFANLIGMGLGPLVVGVLSDLFRPWAAEESLRYALLMLCPGYLWAAWHVWRASRTVAEDLIAHHLEGIDSGPNWGGV